MDRFMLTTAIDLNMVNEFKNKVLFLSEYIISFDIVKEKNKIIAVDLLYDKKKISKKKLEELLNVMIEKEFCGRIMIEEKVLWENKTDRLFFGNMYEELVQKEEVVQISEGIVAIGELFYQICAFFDKEIVKIAQENFDVKLMHYPSLIKYDTLDKVEYVRSLPQFLMFVSSLHGDVNDYYKYKEYGFDYDNDYDKIKGLRLCLPPSVCYHTYQQYRNRCLNNQSIVISAIGKTFRNEGKYAKKLERLWDFTMREVIFLGDKKFVEQNNMEKFMTKIIELLERIGLDGRIVSASDLFYKGEEQFDIRILRKIKKNKYEIRLKISNSDEISVGSFNLHGKFFGEKFGIKFDDKNFAYTSCTGYGLERFAYAFLCQYGLDKNQWPIYIKERF